MEMESSTYCQNDPPPHAFMQVPETYYFIVGQLLHKDDIVSA